MSKAKRAYRGEILDLAVRHRGDSEQVRTEIGEALGERYWAATLAVLGSSRWNYGKNLWIENGVVFEQGMSLHHFMIGQIVAATSDGGRLDILIAPKNQRYSPSVSEEEASRFVDDLEAVASYAVATADPGWATRSADLEGDAGSGPRWEYMHIFLAASPATDAPSHALGGIKGRVGRYPRARIEDALNQLGRQGWMLVTMEPHWFYERVGVSLASEVTRPKAIIGWYCTFRREARDSDDASHLQGEAHGETSGN